MNIQVTALAKQHPKWAQLRAFAEMSAWSAGPYLSRMMGEEDAFPEWERVFMAEADGRIAGYCTFTKTDELPEKWGFFPFIGFVYVDEKYRGHRISQRLIDGAVAYAGACGFSRVYLMSGEHGLYEKYGFEYIGDYETVFGTVDQLFVKRT